MTAMHIAAEKNSEGSMKLLLNAGATVDVTTDVSEVSQTTQLKKKA